MVSQRQRRSKGQGSGDVSDIVYLLWFVQEHEKGPKKFVSSAFPSTSVSPAEAWTWVLLLFALLGWRRVSKPWATWWKTAAMSPSPFLSRRRKAIPTRNI